MTDVRRRRSPLRVDRPLDGTAAPGAVHRPAPAGVDLGVAHVNPAHERTDEDRRSFAAAVRALRTGGPLALSERTLMVLGGVLAPLGLLLVLLGWIGASRTPNVFEQVPYLISGGLLGLGLVFLGAFLYFTHWLTELVREHRTQSAALLDAIAQLRSDLAAPAVPVAASVAGEATLAPLVATSRGSMVHRPDCVVVAGKDDVHVVERADGLTPCKLCDPFDEGPSVN